MSSSSCSRRREPRPSASTVRAPSIDSVSVALITEYKNVRSHLELLTLSLTNVSQVPAIAAATLCGELATVYPYELTEINQVSQVPRFGIGHWSVETVWVYPQTA